MPAQAALKAELACDAVDALRDRPESFEPDAGEG
jgi:hypothetical protein